MNTLITFKQGCAENSKQIDMPAMAAAKVAASIADYRPVVLNTGDCGYMAEVIIEIGCKLCDLEAEYLKTCPYSSMGADLYSRIKELKLAAAWIEMENLRLRSQRRLDEAMAGAI